MSKVNDNDEPRTDEQRTTTDEVGLIKHTFAFGSFELKS